MAKGGQFERDTCRELSLWWTDGKADDLFWRTSNSGGRATVRARKGKTTTGHAGDIGATDDRGRPLVDLITFELKRGYSKFNIHEVLDKPVGAVDTTFEKWILQAEAAAEKAGTEWWAVVHKRDRRRTMIFFPADLEIRIFRTFAADSHRVTFRCRPNHHAPVAVTGMLLDKFLARVEPETIKDLVRRARTNQ